MPSKAFDFGLPFRRGATTGSDSSPPSNPDSATAYDGDAERRASVSVSGLHDTTHRGLYVQQWAKASPASETTMRALDAINGLHPTLSIGDMR
jgi:hypothetical protein